MRAPALRYVRSPALTCSSVSLYPERLGGQWALDLETCEAEGEEFFSLCAPNELLPPPETWMEGSLCFGSDEERALLEGEKQKMEFLHCDEEMLVECEQGRTFASGERKRAGKWTDAQNGGVPCILGTLLLLETASEQGGRVPVAICA